MRVPGPDALTTCGNPSVLLRISEQYVIGVGGICEPISEWSTLRSYSSSELQELRKLAQDFQEGTLQCSGPFVTSSSTSASTSAITSAITSVSTSGVHGFLPSLLVIAVIIIPCFINNN